MCAKDSNNPPTLLPLSNPNLRASNALSHIPITPKESSRPSVERVPYHATVLYWPFRQNGKSTTEYAAKVEFAVGEDVLRLLAYGIEVLLRPAFLEGDYVRRWLD
jgi:hypothetical protein